MSTGRQILDIPMCLHCAVACEHDDQDKLLGKALGRVERADGGLSRQRWMALKRKRNNASMKPLTRTKLNQLGGDSSMDMPEPPDTPLAVTTKNKNKNKDEDGTHTECGDGETIARLHYRRSKDPRFAELECLVPRDAPVYVSILDPLNAPAFRPCPAKPVPEWMHLLPRKNTPEEEEARPRSILDVHFPPAAAFATSPPLSRVDELQRREDPIEGEREMGTEIGFPRFPSTARSLVTSPPSLSPPHHRGLQRRTSSESLHSQFLGGAESPQRSLSPPADSRFPPASSASPPPYKRPSAVADEPLRRPSSRLTGLGLCGGTDDRDRKVTTSVDTTSAGTTNNRNKNTKPTLGEKGKGKSVAWDKTVSGGESYERTQMEPGLGDGGLVLEEERPQTPPRRRPSPLAAVWQRVVKTGTEAGTKTPPAQSNEFLDLYAADKAGETRLASLAMPGRRRGKEVGWARGRVCEKCGNVSNE